MSQPELQPERNQPLLTAIAVVATLLALPVLLIAGEFRGTTLLGILFAAALVAAGRDTAHATVALLVVGLLWLYSGADGFTAWSVVLAVLMLTMHAAAALRSSVPPGAAIDRVLALRWLRRVAVVSALTVVVYLVGLAVRQLDRGGSQLVVALALCLVGALVLLLRRESLARS